MRKILAAIALGFSFAAAAQTPVIGVPSTGGIPKTVSAGPAINIYEQFVYAIANVMTLGNIGAVSGSACGINTALSDSNHPAYAQSTSGTGGAGTGVGCRLGNVIGAAGGFNLNQAPGWTFETDAQPSVLPGTTAASYQTGMTANPNTYPWTGVGFNLSSTLGVANNWNCHYNTTDVDSGVAATLTWTRLSIVSDGVKVHWYINGVEACGTGIAIASMPAGGNYLASTAVAQTATSVSLNYAYFIFQRNVTR